MDSGTDEKKIVLTQKVVDKPVDSAIMSLPTRKALQTKPTRTNIMSLIICKNKVSYEELLGVETPAATESHTPICHALLVKLIREAVSNAGLEIVEEEHGLHRGGQRYFGGFALTGKTINGPDRQVVLGARNSHDKAFAAAICIGNRVMICENLCFASDIKLARRHTLNILTDLPRVIADAVGRCVSHWNDMGIRIEKYKQTILTNEQAENLVIRLVDSRAIPSREIYNVITEFRNPRHDEFKGGSLWTLYNALTECLKGSDLSKLPYRTMMAQSILDPVASHVPAIEVQEIVTKGCEDEAPEDGEDFRD